MSGVITERPKSSSRQKPKGKPKQEDLYYNEVTKEYLWPKENGGWLRLNESSAKRQLIETGVSRTRGDAPLSPVDKAINSIQLENSIIYAAPLSGHKAGIYECPNGRFLVTESPKIIVPKEGDWATLKWFIEGLFREEENDQLAFLYGWLKVAYKAIDEGVSRPGQALVIAGEAGCGKSLLQNIITEILGGRSAKPYQYMTGATSFNSDLFGAEHLMIEDEAASSDNRTRRKFANEIKGMTVNETNRCHSKGKNAVVFRPIWRLSITVNDEPEHLMVLPPLDDSLRDKIIMLRAYKQQLPTTGNEERAAFRQAISDELPGFLYWLEEWKIPDDLVSPRFGITDFQHPYLLEAINELSPEIKLWNMVQRHVLGKKEEWKGTAAELENSLSEKCSPREVNRVLYWDNACGVLLGRLEKQKPSLVHSDRSKTSRGWIVLKEEIGKR